ncbi:MAG: diguanylate cyclase [Campylobacterales bacterium]|nr:diguanylate cyclase [Campylobacterales bacterium]
MKKLDIQEYLNDFSLQLRQETDFKNVWFQLVDKNATVISRSWCNDRGDNLFATREFKDITKVHTTIDVDRYDLSFKALVPFFDNNHQFIGFLETITHFNSISKKIAQEGFNPVIIVDKLYAKKLQSSFSKHFLEGYYIANKDVQSDTIEYIKDQRMASMLNYKTSYQLKKPYLVVHHTLFDNQESAMAYILMFKPINKIDNSSLENINLVINIVTLFVIVLLFSIFFGLYHRSEKSIESHVNVQRYFLFFVALFVVLLALFYFILQISYNQKKEEFIKNHNYTIEKDFDIVENKYKTVAHTMFETVINRNSVKKIVQKAYKKPPSKVQAREELYQLLIRHYKFFQTYDVRQLHFHLKNNESFLRFHRPQKYGDNLTGIRSTVEWVNENHLSISGFEEGRIFNGFRYVFPLIYGNTAPKLYLGSVEVSFSAHAIAREFAFSRNAKTGFFIDKKIVNAKVFSSEKENYIDSPLESFYYEEAITKQLEYEFKHINIEQFSSDMLHYANKKIFAKRVFTLVSKDEKYLFTFVPLQNPVSKKVVAAIVLQIENTTLMAFWYNYLIMFAIGLVLILLTTIFLYREYLSKLLFRNLSLRTKSILDTQKSMIVITTGKEIVESNQTFLDFFGYDCLDAFKAQFNCVCEHFIEHPSYFHLGKVPTNSNWVRYIDTLPAKDHVVLMKDKNAIEYSFAITQNYYQNDSYVVTFNDISGTIKEQIILQHKIIVDSLTGAYNREFFDSNIDNIIQKCYSNKTQLGIIFFDIDHFKNINDTYGHHAGDEVLKELVLRVGASIRDDDYLLRWGGEEFIVLISVHSAAQAKRVGEHLRSMIEHHQFKEIGQLTCSFGVTLHKPNETIEQSIQRADEALYLSKESGSNRATVY